MLEKVFGNKIPKYIVDNGEDFVTVNIFDKYSPEGKNLRITKKDIDEYVKLEASKTSEKRCLAGYRGDWKIIDNLVQDIFKYFDILTKEKGGKLYRSKRKTVSITPSTYERLLRRKKYHEQTFNQAQTFNQVIEEMLDTLERKSKK